jgi:type II protein arginine methyltransferase
MASLNSTAPQPPQQKLLGEALGLGALRPGTRQRVQAMQDMPDLALRLAHLALEIRGLEQSRNRKADAPALARAAQRLGAADHEVMVLTDWLTRREAPLWHFRILHDQLRNEAYASALQRDVKPGMTVFEIGTGTGLLAMLAARAGAAHVYTCERSADVAEAARAIVRRNGLADRITVIARDAHAVQLGQDMPARADLFVAEILDNSLLGEDVLPLTELARARFLKPEALLLPREIATLGFLTDGQGWGQHYRVDEVMGFDLSPFNRFSPVELDAGTQAGGYEALSEPTLLAHFDLRRDTPAESARRVTLTATRAGRAEVLLRWLRLDFGGGIVFENRPPQPSSWDAHLHVLPDRRQLAAGQRYELDISHDRHRIIILPARAG